MKEGKFNEWKSSEIKSPPEKTREELEHMRILKLEKFETMKKLVIKLSSIEIQK